MTPVPARIHFTGGPGAGKTTMARALAERLGVPYYDLDGMLLDGEQRWVPAAAVAEVAATLPAIAARPGWVSDGAYLEWTEPLLRAADVIFLVDTPGRLALYRVFARHIKADRAGNNRFPGWRRFLRFWKWCVGYYLNSNPHARNAFGVPNTRALAARELAVYGAKVVAVRSQRQRDAILTRWPSDT